MKILLKVLKAIGNGLGFFLLFISGYFIYVFVSFRRLPDWLSLKIDPAKEPLAADQISVNKNYRILSYNIGFGAYTPDFSFFMDGGKYAWGKSKESVTATVQGATAFAHSLSPDFLMLQEIDTNSTRSYHIDQYALIAEELKEYSASFALDYNSPFLMYPFH